MRRPGAGQVPVDERHRPQARATIAQASTATGVDGVVRGQVVVAHHLVVPGQRRARGQVVELADEFGHPDQASLGRHTRHVALLPGHVAVHEGQDLPPLLVHAQEPGRAAPARPLEKAEELVHEPAAPAPHRVTGTDHGIDRTAPQRVLTHLSILDRLNLPPEHVEAAGVVMLLLTAALLWQRR